MLRRFPRSATRFSKLPNVNGSRDYVVTETKETATMETTR